MFVTGPDVIKTVTHEEVTKEELGGALTHAAKSGVCHFTVPNDAACLAALRDLLSYLPSNNLDDPPPGPQRRRSGPRVRGARQPGARGPQPPYDIKRLIAAGGRRRRLPRGARPVRPQPGRRLRPLRQPQRRHRRQPAGLPRRRARHRRLAARARASCASATPSTSRSSPSRTCPASCPARSRSSAASSSTAPSCSSPCRGHGAEDHRDHPQGLRRRLLRDGEQAPAHRRQPRLPDRRDRGHGPGGRGQHPLPPRARGGRRARPRRCAPRRSRSTGRRSRTPTSPPSAASSTRSSSRGAPAPRSCARCASWRPSASSLPPKKHGNIPL